MQEDEVGQRDKLYYLLTTQINFNPSLSKGCVSQKKKLPLTLLLQYKAGSEHHPGIR